MTAEAEPDEIRDAHERLAQAAAEALLNEARTTGTTTDSTATATLATSRSNQ